MHESTQTRAARPDPPTRGELRGLVRRLDSALVNQIAAGEVVERPASVVKELVENSLDAGAARVRVEVRAGGRDWIAVSDDGRGMSPADARLCLERHATSKIAQLEDLDRIASYGFRGEALPAIASVSKLRLRTRCRDLAEATELQVEAGRLVGERAAGGPVGTRVEVSELFGAIPARRKFLKTAATEWGHVADWLARSALALPRVHFDVRRDDRDAISWPATSDRLDRVASVLGEQDAGALVPALAEEGAAALEGLVSRPDRHRPTLAGVYLFVNGRPVRNRLLQHALLEVYRDVLPRGRFPAAVLFVTLPPQAVDVNVHPAKWEVRFADPQQLHRLVRSGVRRALEERRWIGGGAPASAAPPGPVRSAVQPSRPAPLTSAPSSAAGLRGGDWTLAPVEPQPAGDLVDPAPRLPATERGTLELSRLPLLGQLLGSYLLLESPDGLLLVDQHAAHERVLYERLRAEWRERGVELQGLLAPVPVTLPGAVLAALLAKGEAVRRLGFDLEPFGADTVAVRAVPALLLDRDPADLVRGLAEELAAADGAEPGPRALDAADHVFASLACHSARRAGEVLDPREQRALLEALDAIPWAPSCPHGRPVVVPIGLGEIERRFGRR